MLRPQYFRNAFIINHKWLVIIGSNLNLQIKLFFYPPITANNNLSHKFVMKVFVKML